MSGRRRRRDGRGGGRLGEAGESWEEDKKCPNTEEDAGNDP